MSKLTIASGQEIARENINRLYRFPKQYAVSKDYLERYGSSLKSTLLAVLNYAKDLNLIIDKHRYEFVLDNKTLTYKVRKKQSESTTNRHMNFLCALGFLKKVYQSKSKDGSGYLLRINQDFLKKNPSAKRPISVFSFHAYTDADLQRIEERAIRLKEAGITSGNIGQNQLTCNGLEDVANEIYFANDRTAPDRKAQEAAVLFRLMDVLCDTYGYVNKEMVKENLLYDEAEIDRLFRIFKLQLNEIYSYSRPTTEDRERWNLKNQRFIFKRRESES